MDDQLVHDFSDRNAFLTVVCAPFYSVIIVFWDKHSCVVDIPL